MCLLITQMEVGSAQKAAVSLSSYLHQAGYPIRLCFLYDKAGLIQRLRAEHDFPIHDLRARRADASGIPPLRVIRACFSFWRLMRGSPADIVLTFTPYSNILGWTIAWPAGVPLWITSQSTVPDHYPRVLWRAEGLLARRGLAEAIYHLWQHPGARQEFGSNASRRVAGRFRAETSFRESCSALEGVPSAHPAWELASGRRRS